MPATKQPQPGNHVVYHDERGTAHEALCTTDWGGCINVLYVSGDVSKKDQYGRQIERESSVIHASDSSVHGRYWRWPDEKANEYKQPVAT